jgi:hypothetical protein
MVIPERNPTALLFFAPVPELGLELELEPAVRGLIGAPALWQACVNSR